MERGHCTGALGGVVRAAPASGSYRWCFPCKKQKGHRCSQPDAAGREAWIPRAELTGDFTLCNGAWSMCQALSSGHKTCTCIGSFTTATWVEVKLALSLQRRKARLWDETLPQGHLIRGAEPPGLCNSCSEIPRAAASAEGQAAPDAHCGSREGENITWPFRASYVWGTQHSAFTEAVRLILGTALGLVPSSQRHPWRNKGGGKSRSSI